jgi:glucose/arabinose dehydrogenase/mono/diheme cytochrome c family protein
MTIRVWTTGFTVLAAFAITSPVFSADVNAGKTAFKTQCALCHTAESGDNGGAQGPDLIGVFGRKAGTNAAFSYTTPLRNSGLVWDAATLDRFLEAPTAVVPGTSMVIPVANKADRENIVAYFQSLKSAGGSAPASASAARAPAAGFQDWKNDKPGRVHRIDVTKLPAPFETPSARNFPKLVERPAGAQPLLPPGFKFDVFATKLVGPRRMVVAANGDVLITETQGGRVSVMRPTSDNSSAASVTAFAEGLRQPFGVTFYPNAKNPQWLYVAETHRVVRYAYKTGDQKATGPAEVVVADLPAGGGHFSRDVVFSADGKLMYVSVGSASNVGENMEKKTPEQIRAWEAEHGLGAGWGPETNRAAVLVYEVGANKSGKIFASGIRNCVSLEIQPKTGDLWCTTNERDLLGDDLVPDYSTRVKKGAFYGWPWYYMGNHEDPRLKGDRPDLASKVTVPDVPFQAHSAADNLIFYTATTGKSAFPKEYVGDGFAVLHGSWNRAFRTGHKIVRVKMKNDEPTGEYEDFLTGFIVDDGNAWARPVAAAVMNDGSMLLSDDGSNVVYRISYSK